VGCSRQDSFAEFAGELLNIKGYDFGCISVKQRAKFIENPPLGA
jgi:hypothetical protein